MKSRPGRLKPGCHLGFVGMAGSSRLDWHSPRSWQEEVNARQECGRRSLQLYHLRSGNVGAAGQQLSALLLPTCWQGFVNSSGHSISSLRGGWEAGAQLGGCAWGVQMEVLGDGGVLDAHEKCQEEGGAMWCAQLCGTFRVCFAVSRLPGWKCLYFITTRNSVV